ncbi:MAG: pyridoxal-phosphate dependent enzyme, partial [Candidatus Limnocylindria bacterium]
DTEGRITHFVAGVGTGGTISGAGRYLKEQRPDLMVVGADTEGSVFSGGPIHPYLTEGIGEDFWPGTYDPDVADVIVRVPDRDAFLTARAAAAAEGILVGESGGTALWAALQVARDVDDPDALFVVLLPDSGRSYVSKLYNDGWLREAGIIGPDEQVSDYDWRASRPEVVVRRSG